MTRILEIFRNLLIAVDQAVNCLIRMGGEWGYPDETLSARAWRKRDRTPAWPRWIDRIFFWDRADGKRHCQLAFENEILRGHMPPAYRGLGE